MINTTDKDFELFQRECNKWINILGMHEWEIMFIHFNLVGILSEITSHNKPKIAVIKFAKTFDYVYPTKNKMIKDIAQHEIFHLLLEDLWNMASERSFDSEQYQSCEHSVIHRLQKAFKDFK